MHQSKQLSLVLPTWGGKRRRAGRPSDRERAAVPHETREAFTDREPVHVTIRVLQHVWNLRSERSFAVFDGALREAQRRPGFAVIQFGILGNHVHLVVEADGARALGDGMRALTIRLARRLNVMMERRGRVFDDRYHAHVLRTPAEARNALRYVLGNFASHAARWGEATREERVDPYSSAVVKVRRTAQGLLFVEPATRPARTWLLRQAMGAAGDRVPAATTATMPENGRGPGSARRPFPLSRNCRVWTRAGNHLLRRFKFIVTQPLGSE